MIRITAFRQGNVISEVTCTGHAGYDETGSDIVCAAVSALMINTVNSIEQFTEDELTVDEAVDGDGYLSFRLGGEVSERASLLTDSLLLGLETIEETYGEQFLALEVRDRESM